MRDFDLLGYSIVSCVYYIPCCYYRYLLRCPYGKILWVVNFWKTKNKLSINLSLLYTGVLGQKPNPFPKLISQTAKVVFLICWIWLSDQILVVRDSIFINGILSWMLLSFKFLFVCSVGVKLFISGEKFFVISLGEVFLNCFLECAKC